MSVEIREIPKTKKALKRYVNFGIDHYRGNDCFVPPLVFDEVATLRPEGNPAFEFCDAQSFMAYRDGKPVGRITAIINHSVNERSGRKEGRFGWVDFIDDDEVADALFAAASDWLRQRGMETLVGPMGFTDMDHEGMLVEGFDELGTIATIYNHPYYPRHMERMGFVKDTDWVEYRMTVPDKVPDKYQRISDIVSKKYDLHVAEVKSRKELKRCYGRAFFELVNEAYDQLYGYSPLTPALIDHYIDMYLGVLRLDDICIIVDKDDKLIGAGISLPSLSKALQKSRGRLWPLGWARILKALYRHNDIVDLMLVAIKPEFQNKGVNAMLFSHLLPNYIANGYKWAESNLELEDNHAVQLQWQYFERRQHRRRRAYRRDL